jgi:hypothetical protein
MRTAAFLIVYTVSADGKRWREIADCYDQLQRGEQVS